MVVSNLWWWFFVFRVIFLFFFFFFFFFFWIGEFVSGLGMVYGSVLEIPV